jgi:hypothetical protein
MTMADETTFNPSLAFIQDGEAIFQVLTPEGEYDDAATAAAYAKWREENQPKRQGFFSRLF